MHYFIDGYNLLFFYLTPDGNLQEKREELIHCLDERCSGLKIKATVIFDNFTNDSSYPQKAFFDSLEVVFTNKGQTADNYILEECNIENSFVVTADNSLANKCRSLGAKIKTPGSFLKWIAKAKEEKEVTKPIEETQENIDKLLKIFEKRLEEYKIEDQ